MNPFLTKILNNKDLLGPYINAIVSNVRIAVLDTRFNIVWVNERFCNLVKYSEEELIGKPIDELNMECRNPNFFDALFPALSQGTKWSGEIKSRAKNGSDFWVKTNILPIKNDNNEIESYLVLNSNITATKNALEEKNVAMENLVRSEDRYRVLVENQSDFISLCKADGTRIYVNNSYCKFFGKSVDELIGTNIREVPFVGVPRKFTLESFLLTPDDPEASGIFELKNFHQEKFWISLRVKGIFDANGSLYEILTIGRDVTSLKNAELQKTNYIEDLERIAFMTSHNVRGPIATTLGLIELLRMNAIHTEQWSQVLDRFKKCIVDMDVYTREMSEFIYQRQSSK
jgi:PAS domain S-box-containing protein